jgi:hypothetical protein
VRWEQGRAVVEGMLTRGEVERVAASRAQADELLDASVKSSTVWALSPITSASMRCLREPVPDWPANRLIYTVGVAREDVAALDLEEAVDLWAEFRSKSR